MTAKILPPYYPAVFVMKRDSQTTGVRHVDLWHFKSLKSGRMFLVEVEVYTNHIYSIKFYPKNMATSRRRFTFRTEDREPRRIVLTCIQIMKLYLEQDSKGSFAFIGAHEENEPLKNNQRFRFYQRMMDTYIGHLNFVHFADTENSAYVIIRRSEYERGHIDENKIMQFFDQIYIFD